MVCFKIERYTRESNKLKVDLEFFSNLISDHKMRLYFNHIFVLGQI